MYRRKIGVIIVALLILAAVGAAIIKTRMASVMRENIIKEMAALRDPFKLTAGNVQVSWLDSSVTLTDVKGEYKGASGVSFKLAADKIEAKGISTEIFSRNASTGVIRIARQAAITGLTYETANLKASVGVIQYGEITGDLGRILNDIREFPQYWAILENKKLLNEPPNRQKVFKFLSSALSSFETLRIDNVTARNYDVSSMLQETKIRVTIDSMRVHTYSLREIGAGNYSPIAVTVNDQLVCAIESLSWDNVKIPSFLELVVLLADAGVPAPERMKAVFQEQAFGLNNMRLKNVAANMHGDAKTPLFTLAHMALSYEADAVHSIKFDYSGLIVDKNRVQSAFDLSNDAAALLPPQIDASGGFETQINAGNFPLVAADCKNIALKEAGLGEVSVRFAVDNFYARTSHLGAGPAMELTEFKSFAASLVDSGASDVLFTALADEANNDENDRTNPDGGVAVRPRFTAESCRALVIAGLVRQRDTLPNRTLQEVANAGITFLTRSGSSLMLSVTPQEPANLGNLLRTALTEPERLNIKVAVAPVMPKAKE
jgi:hypothetical protein